jgi:general secretion pathway protein K
MKIGNAITKRKFARQQGVAIIMVLLIVALATSLAAYIAMQQNLWQRQIESQFDRAQARQLGMAGIDWARAVLGEDARTSAIDHEKEIWTLKLPAIPVEGGEVTGTIEDRQGRFNLNNVSSNTVAGFKDFQTLLGELGLPVDLAAALSDWIDNDSELQPGGAEDSYYTALPQPYRAANRALAELGELTQIKGFDIATIKALQNFVSVLPVQGTPVNVNFASAEVLVAIIPGLNLSDANQLVQQRQTLPFNDENDFKQRLPQGLGATLVINKITVKTNYFWVTGRAKVGNAQVVTQVLLDRTNNGWPTISWQSVQ